MERPEEIIDHINTFLSDEFEVDKAAIQPGANMRQVLELDSLDFIDLVVVIENNFSFKVKPEDFAGITTFQDFYQYVFSRLDNKEVA